MKKIGDKLYELRLERKLSQEQLGEKIGVTRQTISLWEANKRQIKAEKLKLICEVLEVAPKDFFLENSANDEVACDELKQESECEEIDASISAQAENKKLSKINKVLIAIIIVSIVLGTIAAIVGKMLTYNDGQGYETAARSIYNFGDLCWIILGIVSLVMIVAAALLIKNSFKHKK